VVETSATAPPVTGMVIILSLFPMPETIVKALENSLFLSHLSLNSVKCDKLRSELMEQIMGGRYTARGMWGERRSHRRTGGGRAGSWQGQAGYGGGHPDEMIWGIAGDVCFPSFSGCFGIVFPLVLFYGGWFVYKESLPPLRGRISTSTVFHLP
jgi:hypothetical protein